MKNEQREEPKNLPDKIVSTSSKDASALVSGNKNESSDTSPGEKDDGICKEKTTISLPLRIIHVIFILIFTVLTVLFARGILRFTPPFRDKFSGGEILPYYRTFIHYPREDVMNNGMIIFLLMITLYLCLDFLFFSRMKGWKKVLSVIFSIIAIIGVTEYSMSFYSKIYPEMHRPSASLFWELSPDLNGVSGGDNVYTDSHGFRSPEIPMEKPPGQIRVMILGDSSAFGFRVKNEEAFGSVAVKMLRQKYPGKDIRLINASVAGWTTYQASVFMKEKGWKFSPDIIIIAFNDDPQDEWKEDVERAPSPKIMPLMKVLYKSHIYLTVKKLVLNVKLKNSPSKIVSPSLGEAKKRVSLQQFRNNLDSIIDGATDRGAKVIAVSMPLQFSAGFIRDYRNTQKKAADEEDFPSIDFIKEFRKYPPHEVFMDIMHPTVKGHRIIGEKLYELIVNTGWLDK